MQDADDEEDDEAPENPGCLDAQTLWDSRAVTWAVAADAQERTRRSKFVTRKWPLQLDKLPAAGLHGEVRQLLTGAP